MSSHIPTLGPAQVFNLQEANTLLEVIIKVTKTYYEEVTELEGKMQRLLLADPRRREYQLKFQQLVTEWKRKMEGLGLHVQGLWRLKFDVGDGYLCWQYPELSVSHFLEQNQAWRQRVKLAEYIDFNDPDWAY